MSISLVGSYIQIDQAIAAADEGGASASDIMFVAVILAFAPFTIFASPKHQIVRTLTVPTLAAVSVFLVVIVVTIVPAIVIFQGCNAGDNLQILLSIFGVTAIAAGVGAFVLVLLTLILGKRQPPNAVE